MQARPLLESFRQSPRPWTSGGQQYRAVGNRARSPRGSERERHAADTQCEAGGYLQRLTGDYPANRIPGARTWVACSQMHRPERKDLPQRQY